MTLVSLTDCCRLLVIDPKTLRRWLSLAHVSVHPHPLDARLKCVTREQLQQVAATHRRTFASPERPPVPAEISALSTPTSEMSASVLSSVVADVSGPITELTTQLSFLQAHVATLQHQLTLLTEQWQKEQAWRTSMALTFEESSQDKPQDKPQDKSQDKPQDKPQDKSQDKPQDKSQDKPQDKSQESSLEKESARTPMHTPSIDRRKYHHVLPLVEYGVEGKYVLISPEQGRLSFEPDSPEWFAWLSTLPSFRFIGQHGRLTAFRGYQCTPNTPWWAHRQIHSHSHKHRLGTTASVTIASLELAASSLQALVK